MRRGIRDSFMLEIDESCEVKIRCENGELEIGENSRVGNHEILRVIIINYHYYLEIEIGKNVTQLAKISY